MIILLLRHFPLLAASLAFALLEISTGTFVTPHLHFSVRAYLGVSIFIGLAVLIWLIANGRRASRPIEEQKD